MQDFTDFFQRLLFFQQQIPRLTPDLCLLGMRFNPTFVAGILKSIRVIAQIGLHFPVDIAIGCAPGPATVQQLGTHAFATALANPIRLKAGERKEHAHDHASVRRRRVEIRIGCHPHRNAQFDQLVKGPNALHIVATKAIYKGDTDVREFTEPSIRQELLILLTVRCPAREGIPIFGNNRYIRLTHQPLDNQPPLAGLGAFGCLRLFITGA
ncbi:MAG: hypothetical protein L0154_15575 [Chloroflexi bacterium]|nr:hypothetical protein [Chloroflexota bacterium]